MSEGGRSGGSTAKRLCRLYAGSGTLKFTLTS